jgi:hypothetical protein
MKGSCEERIWGGSFVEKECEKLVWNSCIHGEYRVAACKTIEKQLYGKKVRSSWMDRKSGAVTLQEVRD